jgi:hypothetical protein
MQDIFPFKFLYYMPGIGEGKFFLAGPVMHDYSAGMVEIAMGQNDMINILACQAKFLQFLRDVPFFDDPENLLLFFGHLIAQTCINNNKGFRSLDQERIIEELDIIVFRPAAITCDNRIFFCPKHLGDNPEHGAAVQLEFAAVEPEYLKIAMLEASHINYQELKEINYAEKPYQFYCNKKGLSKIES